MNDYGIKVAFPGTDTTSHLLASGIQDFGYLQFSSGLFVYKVIATGTVSLAIPSTLPLASRTDTITVAHGLSYTPLTGLFFTADNTNWFPTNCDTEGSTSGQPFRSALIGADASNITISIVSSHLAAYTFTGRYIIYAEAGS